jgi:hypothetical protein
MAGYYDSKFIYNKTGYWGEELYRFGIVYILHNNELSPVFNVRGKLNITEFNEENQQFKHFPIYENDQRVFVKYSEKTKRYKIMLEFYDEMNKISRRTIDYCDTYIDAFYHYNELKRKHFSIF